ncbi:MAG: SsrA-binding protein SmpB [Chloroflexi bacterium]|nr:SsrA-binding protein SmpB [Chloroflexota bacterium]
MPRAERSKATDHSRVIAVNRRAYHDYDILETVEAGLVLTGTEIKSLRAAQMDIQHAFARVEGGEAWLLNAHISQYPQGNIYNHDPVRPRKLLLHAREIGELAGTTTQKGLTLIPLRVYIKGHVAKVQIGLARGRKLYDKRQAIIEKEQEREIGRAVRAASRG